jgi:CheY-like chemotaxis protein
MEGRKMITDQARSDSKPGHHLDGMTRVLVVEDDPFAARMLGRLLASRGLCQVVHATTVAEALELLQPPPDWVILDMQLPDGLGLAVLQAVREAHLPTRVIVSSSTRDTHLIAAFAAYRPDVIITKPLSSALLPVGMGERC